jgi:hypothetical protein
MNSEWFKNGWMIINGGKAEPIPDYFLDIPNKEEENCQTRVNKVNSK